MVNERKNDKIGYPPGYDTSKICSIVTLMVNKINEMIILLHPIHVLREMKFVHKIWIKVDL